MRNEPKLAVMGHRMAWRPRLMFDMGRGIEILRMKGGPHASAPTVHEPRAADRLAAVPVEGLTPARCLPAVLRQ